VHSGVGASNAAALRQQDYQDSVIATDEDDGTVEPAERLRRWWRGTADGIGQWGAALWGGVRPAVERVVSDPAFLAAVEAPRVNPADRPRNCHCLCQAVHPDQQGICEMDSPVTTRRFLDVDVPLCAPCAAAAA
jgi:hypothetical protein